MRNEYCYKYFDTANELTYWLNNNRVIQVISITYCDATRSFVLFYYG